MSLFRDDVNIAILKTFFSLTSLLDFSGLLFDLQMQQEVTDLEQDYDIGK